jgi:predicted nucleotidyltransferase
MPNLGMIQPIMGTNHQLKSSVADALFPKVRQRVLAVLFGNPDRSYYASEIIAAAKSGSGAVQRELAGLAAAGLLTVSRQGNQTHYQANSNSPIFAELRSMVLKTSGLADVLRTVLSPLSSQITAAFVYGSVAKNQDTAKSDIDVMVVSESLSYAELFGAMETATTTLGRSVNPTLYTHGDIAKRRAQDSAFVTRVLDQPKIWLVGNEETLNA